MDAERYRKVTNKVLRQCLFAYMFLHLVWVFPFYPLLSKTQIEALDRQFRVGIRMVRRCPFISASDIFILTKVRPRDFYVKDILRR
jgi:hypothetical protein